jgi:hypothetical protein
LPTKDELIEAIKECESKESSYDNCVKLSIFYSLYDRYYAKDDEEKNSFNYKGNKKFSELLAKNDINNILNLFAEVLECLEVVNPKLYNSIIDRLS